MELTFNQSIQQLTSVYLRIDAVFSRHPAPAARARVEELQDGPLLLLAAAVDDLKVDVFGRHLRLG